jgi:hypothetical protein
MVARSLGSFPTNPGNLSGRNAYPVSTSMNLESYRGSRNGLGEGQDTAQSGPAPRGKSGKHKRSKSQAQISGSKSINVMGGRQTNF